MTGKYTVLEAWTGGINCFDEVEVHGIFPDKEAAKGYIIEQVARHMPEEMPLDDDWPDVFDGDVVERGGITFSITQIKGV